MRKTNSLLTFSRNSVATTAYLRVFLPAPRVRHPPAKAGLKRRPSPRLSASRLPPFKALSGTDRVKAACVGLEPNFAIPKRTEVEGTTARQGKVATGKRRIHVGSYRERGPPHRIPKIEITPRLHHSCPRTWLKRSRVLRRGL